MAQSQLELSSSMVQSVSRLAQCGTTTQHSRAGLITFRRCASGLLLMLTSVNQLTYERSTTQSFSALTFSEAGGQSYSLVRGNPFSRQPRIPPSIERTLV